MIWTYLAGILVQVFLALVIFWLALTIGLRAWGLVRAPALELA